MIPQGRGGAGPVVGDLVGLHDPPEFFQHLADFLHQGVADLAGVKGVPAQGNHVADVVDLPHTGFGGNLVDSHFQLKGAYVDCGK